MPSNRVSFRVTLDEPETLSLATAAGDPIEAHIVTRAGDRLFEPVAPLEAGSSLVLTYTICPGAGIEPAKLAFTTSEPSDIEVQPGALEVAERGVIYPDRGDQAIAFVRLRYTSPDARGNAAHLFEHRASVDGQPTFFTNDDGVLGIDVHTVCNEHIQSFTPGMCGGIYSMPPGRHVVEVQSHILGEALDPEPVRLAIETRCPQELAREADAGSSPSDDSIDVDDTVDVDDGDGPIDAGETIDVSADGTESEADLDGIGTVDIADGGSGRSDSRSLGCAFRPSPVTGGASVLGLLLVLARRRRNRR